MKNIGLVVGKFSPLHYGHQFLLDKASKLCDHLIIISYTSNDWYDVLDREYWLKFLYPGATVVVKPHTSCPDDNASEDIHRQFCFNIIKYELNTEVHTVFSSEAYGYPFAEFLSKKFRHYVEHKCVDIDRLWFPISGSSLRANMDSKFVCPLVLNSLKPKILILGGESSGKSTLAKLLGKYTNEPVVEEYGRELWERRSGLLQYSDMLSIAEKQIKKEREAANKANLFIICDTSPLTTYFYSLELFGRADNRLIELSKRKYEKVILLDNSIPFIQDGTRKDEKFRELGYNFYINRYKNAFTPKSVNIIERIEESLEYIWKS